MSLEKIMKIMGIIFSGIPEVVSRTKSRIMMAMRVRISKV